MQWYDYDRNIQGPWGDTWYTVWCIACTHDCRAVQWIVSEYCFSLITHCPQLNAEGSK